MADHETREDEPLTFFACAPRCDHVWDGPEIKIEHGALVSCSKCGALAINEAMWGDD